jgi:hypothetical protein
MKNYTSVVYICTKQKVLDDNGTQWQWMRKISIMGFIKQKRSTKVKRLKRIDDTNEYLISEEI